ncbi:MAG: hypothetical protein KGL35_30275, partial [Bradyrhizobium sp.]|nr:hypothetical protein [Bradyrhizobium sp.]
WREEGPKKFWVHLAHQLPVGTTLENPVLLIGAEHEHEAREKYKTSLGIRRTPHDIAVVPAVEGEACPVAEVMRLAMEGYHPEAI